MSAEQRNDRSAEPSGRFDFERLEQSVGALLRDHDRLAAEREALLAELAEREHRLAVLEGRLDRERMCRVSAAEGVDRLIARVESLQSRFGALSCLDPVPDPQLQITEDVKP